MKILYPRFLEHITSTQLIKPDDHIIVALSGGKDSVTLTLLLKELQKELSFTLSAAYFNHLLRHDAQDEERWVKSFCRDHQLELQVSSQDVGKISARQKLNLENAASISRYRFLVELARALPGAKVATAHTRSDLTETFFIKLLRGSGLQGLSAIHSQKGTSIVRPLLLFSKEEIISFLKRNKIPHYRDYTNDHPDFLRNRIRQELIPELQKVSHTLDNHIYKTVSIIQQDYEFLTELGKRILAKTVLLAQILPTSRIKTLHLSLQRIVIREYIRMLKGDLLNIDFEHIDGILAKMESARGLAIPGLRLTFSKGFIFPRALSIPDYVYSISDITPTLKLDPIEGRLEMEESAIFSKPADNFQISLPRHLLQFPLQLRAARPEDRYQKIHSAIRQKVFEMIRASGIPAQLRRLRPVLVNGDGQIIWVAGCQIADPFKVPLPAATSVVTLKFRAKHAE